MGAASLKSDIEVAREYTLSPIARVAAKLDIPDDSLSPYGRHIAKIEPDFLASLAGRPEGKLILVTAINPTPAGEGKTTTTIGLGDGLNRIGKRAAICLREPSLGPCFGQKGGATGGGRAQVAPMEEINLHFTGDFHAISAAHNLAAAMLDNHIYWGNALDIDPRRITWRRVVDMNDRALRATVAGLGGAINGFPREDGFEITVASEVMAAFCLATSLDDLEARLKRMVVAQTRAKTPVTIGDLKAQGAMTALLLGALRPNLVQTLEGLAGADPWRPVRQYRAWLQFGDRDARGAAARRLCGDRGRVRRRSRRGEILRHQMPAGGAEAVGGGGRRDGAGAEDERRRSQGRFEPREPCRARVGPQQSRASC